MPNPSHSDDALARELKAAVALERLELEVAHSARLAPPADRGGRPAGPTRARLQPESPHSTARRLRLDLDQPIEASVPALLYKVDGVDGVIPAGKYGLVLTYGQLFTEPEVQRNVRSRVGDLYPSVLWID